MLCATMVGLSSETIRGFLLQIVGQFQWDKDVLLQDFWVPLFQTSLLFLTGSEANPMLELMTSKHEDPPGDAMPCDFAQGKKHEFTLKVDPYYSLDGA